MGHESKKEEIYLAREESPKFIRYLTSEHPRDLLLVCPS